MRIDLPRSSGPSPWNTDGPCMKRRNTKYRMQPQYIPALSTTIGTARVNLELLLRNHVPCINPIPLLIYRGAKFGSHRQDGPYACANVEMRVTTKLLLR
jgi:hypothetical protein